MAIAVAVPVATSAVGVAVGVTVDVGDGDGVERAGTVGAGLTVPTGGKAFGLRTTKANPPTTATTTAATASLKNVGIGEYLRGTRETCRCSVLSMTSSAPHDHPVGDFGRAFLEPAVEDPFDVAVAAHCGRPPMAMRRSSASRAARIARCA